MWSTELNKAVFKMPICPSCAVNLYKGYKMYASVKSLILPNYYDPDKHFTNPVISPERINTAQNIHVGAELSVFNE